MDWIYLSRCIQVTQNSDLSDVGMLLQAVDKSAAAAGLLLLNLSWLFGVSALGLMAASRMSRKEIDAMDDMNKRGKTPQDILAKFQAAWDRKGESGPSKDGVYRFLRGRTYKRGAAWGR